MNRAEGDKLIAMLATPFAVAGMGSSRADGLRDKWIKRSQYTGSWRGQGY
jgi:hypothetical protein